MNIEEAWRDGYRKGLDDMYEASRVIKNHISEGRKVVFCDKETDVDRLLQTIVWRICGITPDARHNLKIRENSVECDGRTIEIQVYSQKNYLGYKNEDIIQMDNAINWLMNKEA